MTQKIDNLIAYYESQMQLRDREIATLQQHYRQTLPHSSEERVAHDAMLHNKKVIGEWMRVFRDELKELKGLAQQHNVAQKVTTELRLPAPHPQRDTLNRNPRYPNPSVPSLGVACLQATSEPIDLEAQPKQAEGRLLRNSPVKSVTVHPFPLYSVTAKDAFDGFPACSAKALYPKRGMVKYSKRDSRVALWDISGDLSGRVGSYYVEQFGDAEIAKAKYHSLRGLLKT